MTPAGFPHSDIFGSTPACDSPKLFAANHVLHRLLTPRHSPCALSSLVTNLLWSPGRVPHLRRSLRRAKPTFVRSLVKTILPVPQTPELTYVDPEAPAWDESQTGKNCLI